MLLAGHAAAMVTFFMRMIIMKVNYGYIFQMIIMFTNIMIGQLFETMIVADKERVVKI